MKRCQVLRKCLLTLHLIINLISFLLCIPLTTWCQCYMICHTCDHMFILKVHTFKSIHFLQSATNINVIFSLNFHQHCFYFILFYKIIVFSLILCCVVFFTCVCVSLCNVLFKLQCDFQMHPCFHMLWWCCDVIDVATKFFMFWT